MQLVQIKNLNFKLNDTRILKKISLCIQSNEKILLAGANGAGKSTLLRLIAGLHIVRTYDEFSVLGNKIPQDQCNGLSYLGNKWERNISFGGTTPYTADIKVKNMLKMWQDEYKDRRDDLVDILNIDLDWSMCTLSDGQRKKVQIMLALLKPFKLLIIDEFLNELDIITRDRFFNYIINECNTRKCSIIYATHIFDNLDKWIDNVIFISQGTCNPKISMKKFIQNNTLYNTIKNNIENDYKNTKTDNQQKPTFFTTQGYSSGRLKRKAFTNI